MELFVIQRCWFSGPHIEPSVDCRRLFTSRREAEEVAYHSAHDYANRSIFDCQNGAAGTSQPRQPLFAVNAAVKTILLPPSANATANATSSYAFQTGGKLFWVRSVMATVIPPPPPMFMSPPMMMMVMSHQNPTDMGTTSTTIDKAEVVFVEGIIGGTGNPNSRRGSEASEGHVFVSATNFMAHAKRCAVDVLTKLHMNMRSDVNLTVECIPIGKAANGNNAVSQDWPPSQRLVQAQMQLHSMQYNEGTTMEEDQVVNHNKRELVSGDHPNLNPGFPSKRQCQFHRQESQEQGVSCSMMTF
jgi:hypothetical protein